MTSTPTPISLQGPDISYGGISLGLDPILGDEVFVSAPSDWLTLIELSFASDGYCREVGCVTVYPVQSYREGIPGGDSIIDEFQAAIDTPSSTYLPTFGAAILLQAQTRHISFQNGAGIRAIAVRGQDGFFANNEALVYDFHGLSDDGQYYVIVTFPVDAPLLISTYDPAENTNEAAIPVPDLPSDIEELYALFREYNQEAQRQLDLLDVSSFVPDLDLLDALVFSLKVAPSPGE